MKIIRISHLGLAPKEVDKTAYFFNHVLGLKEHGNEVVQNQQVEVSFFECENSRLELLKPTDELSPISKYIQTKGGGIHHIALEVDNVEEWLNHLKKKNIQLIDDKPRLGAHNTKIIFIHPRATGGILVELVEESK